MIYLIGRTIGTETPTIHSVSWGHHWLQKMSVFWHRRERETRVYCNHFCTSVFPRLSRHTHTHTHIHTHTRARARTHTHTHTPGADLSEQLYQSFGPSMPLAMTPCLWFGSVVWPGRFSWPPPTNFERKTLLLMKNVVKMSLKVE